MAQLVHATRRKARRSGAHPCAGSTPVSVSPTLPSHLCAHRHRAVAAGPLRRTGARPGRDAPPAVLARHVANGHAAVVPLLSAFHGHRRRRGPAPARPLGRARAGPRRRAVSAVPAGLRAHRDGAVGPEPAVGAGARIRGSAAASVLARLGAERVQAGGRSGVARDAAALLGAHTQLAGLWARCGCSRRVSLSLHSLIRSWVGVRVDSERTKRAD